MEQYGHVLASEPPPEQLEAAKKLMAEIEQRREQRMLEYSAAKRALPAA